MIDEQELIIKQAIARGLRPIPNISVSEWANTYRFLSSTSSAEAGRYSVSRTPYLREIMDHLGKTSHAQEITFMKGSQIGATEAALCFMGYSIHMNPSIILLVMPTDEAIKKTSRTRVKPMLEATPVLRDKVKPAGGKDSENTINSKAFEGGVLLMIGANSPVGLASTPAAKLLLDEVDRFPLSAGTEGSPIELARARSRTFANRKLFLISTPTNEGTSVIDAEFQKGDMRYYNVSCIHCSQYFIITFDLLTWTAGDPESVRLACPLCGGLHEERHKTILLAEFGFGGLAKWIPTKVIKNKRKHSYHLSALYSPAGFYSWAELIEDFENIKGDVNKEQTFTNTVLGETFKISGEVPDYENLYNKRENYQIGTIPSEVYFLTIGADVQKDRIEFETVGWCPGRQSYSIEYRVLPGDTTSLENEVWQHFKDCINHHYPTTEGTLMSVKMTFVDSGDGTSTNVVYNFCSSMGNERVKPIKGMHDTFNLMVGAPKITTTNKAGKKIGRSKVWGLGVSMIKTEIYGFLKLKSKKDDEGNEIFPNGYCHFPMYNEAYFKMLTAEKHTLVKNKKTGFAKHQWVKERDRNEALDCRVYARGAAYLVGIDRFKEQHWENIKSSSMVFKTVADTVSKKSIRKKSDYWNR